VYRSIIAPDGVPHPRHGGNSDRFAQRLFTPLPRRYDALAEFLSMGQNRRWRRAMVDRIVDVAPQAVLDVACGTAGVSLQLADRTAARIVGVDLTEGMLRQGKRNVELAGMADRIQLVIGRGQQLPFGDGAFDALTFTYLLRYVDDPQSTLDELARVVKPGGMAASLEFLLPSSAFWRFWWWGYTRLLLPTVGWLAGGREWYVVGRFLGPNISGHYRRYPLQWTIDAWRRAGFEQVGARRMSLGGGLVMWGRRSAE
jgi:demethylmenaquinone methyltransferase / 2-methoxy-6-polyprenyl-1,4-benzoquinol methylase